MPDGSHAILQLKIFPNYSKTLLNYSTVKVGSKFLTYTLASAGTALPPTVKTEAVAEGGKYI